VIKTANVIVYTIDEYKNASFKDKEKYWEWRKQALKDDKKFIVIKPYNKINYIKNREKITQGNLLHFALSYIDNVNQENKAFLVEEAIKNARIRYPFIADFIPVKDKIIQLFDKKEIKRN